MLDIPARSLEDFWDIWFSLGFGNAAGMATVFASHKGLYKGTFDHPTTGKKTTFQGTILQKKIGSGYFIDEDQVGAVGIIADDAPVVP